MTNSRIAQPLLSALLAILMVVSMLPVVGFTSHAASVKTGDVTVKKASDGNWYTYTNKGNKKVNYTGVAKNKYGWWRVEKGKVNFKATGVYKNDFGWWYCKGGKAQFDYYGIQKNEYGWWRIEKGKVNFKANGIFKNEYGWWQIVNGKVDFYATGVYHNEYGWWYCKEGKVDFSYNGISMNGYGIWSIKNGKVDFDETKKLGFNKTSPYVVKRIETDWGVEKHIFDYSYDLDKATLTVTNRVTDLGYDWGDGGHMPTATQFMDGLLTPEMFKNHPDIAGEFSEGCFADYFVLAYNPLVKEGKIKKIILVTNYDDRDELYKTEYTLSTQGGLLQKAEIKRKEGSIYHNYQINYYYDGKGCLSGVDTDEYNEKFVWTTFQNDQGLPFQYFPPAYNSDYVYLWYTQTGSLSHITLLEENEPYMTFNYDQKGNLIKVDSNNPYDKNSYILSYNSEDLLISLTKTRRENAVSPTEGNTTFVWKKL